VCAAHLPAMRRFIIDYLPNLKEQFLMGLWLTRKP
jgi:hypothetical protein